MLNAKAHGGGADEDVPPEYSLKATGDHDWSLLLILHGCGYCIAL